MYKSGFLSWNFPGSAECCTVWPSVCAVTQPYQTRWVSAALLQLLLLTHFTFLVRKPTYVVLGFKPVIYFPALLPHIFSIFCDNLWLSCMIFAKGFLKFLDDFYSVCYVIISSCFPLTVELTLFTVSWR